MKELVAFDAGGTGGGHTVELIVEVDDEDGADYVRAASPGELVGKASKALEDALEPIRTAANAVYTKVRSLDVQPAEVQVEFGVKLTGKAGAIIASSEGEAHLTVTLKWTPDS